MAAGPGADPRPRSALAKTVAVVESLATGGRLTDIAHQTELPVSTVHRILQELVAVGWAREGEARTYALGARLMALPARGTGSETITRAARSALRALADETKRTVHFAMVDGDQLVYTDKIEGRAAYAMKSRIGAAIPMHCTAIGKAVLAQLEDAEVRLIAQRTGLPPQTPRTLSDVTKLLRHLRKVRERGWAVDDEENEQHTRCVGAAILDQRGEPIAGVSVSCLVFDLSGEQVDEIAPRVVATARRITDLISQRTQPAGPDVSGGTPPGPLGGRSARPSGGGC